MLRLIIKHLIWLGFARSILWTVYSLFLFCKMVFDPNTGKGNIHMIDLSKLSAASKTVILGVGGILIAIGGWCVSIVGPDDSGNDAGISIDSSPAPIPDGNIVEPPAPIFDGSIVEPPAPGVWDCTPGSGTDYQVGPGKAYTLDTVPWMQLAPGDTVRLSWQNEPYRRRILISSKGTTENPIKICGIPGPNGERPVLDGQDSQPAALAGFRNDSNTRLGMILLYASSSNEWNERPAHITIEGLEIRNAFRELGDWAQGAGCIRINDGGDYVTIRSNVIHGCSNGVFMSSTGDGEQLAEHLLVEGNEFYNNGGATGDSSRSHQMYIQGSETVVQGNYLHDPRPNNGPTGIKDRSPGTIVRYNWIESGVIAIDLVEPQDHRSAVSSHPLRNTAQIYGNVIIYTEDGGRAIHFGEDVGLGARLGPLYVWNNTIHIVALNNAWDNAFLDLDSDDAVAFANNNVIWRTGGRSDGPGITLIQANGTLTMGTNMVGPKWADKKTASWSSVVLGQENITTIAEPGFDFSTHRPTTPSPLTGTAGPLREGMQTPTLEYLMHARTQSRPATKTIGAFE